MGRFCVSVSSGWVPLAETHCLPMGPSVPFLWTTSRTFQPTTGQVRGALLQFIGFMLPADSTLIVLILKAGGKKSTYCSSPNRLFVLEYDLIICQPTPFEPLVITMLLLCYCTVTGIGAWLMLATSWAPR